MVRLIAYEGDLRQAVPGQSITLSLADEIDVSRGDVISSADAPAGVANQFEATIVWMSDQPMLPGRTYWLKIGANTVTATIAHPKYRVSVNTLEHVAAKRLELNEIGVCNVSVDRPIAFNSATHYMFAGTARVSPFLVFHQRPPGRKSTSCIQGATWRGSDVGKAFAVDGESISSRCKEEHTMTIRRLTGTLGLLLVLPRLAGLLLPAPSEASVILVTSRAALGGDDFIDWGQLGAAFTTVPNPSAIVSNST